jgi:hypothetical protein
MGDPVKRAELYLCVCIACHCAVAAVDHISEAVKVHGQQSAIGNIQLHPTKCSALITKVIAPALKEELALDVKAVSIPLS